MAQARAWLRLAAACALIVAGGVAAGCRPAHEEADEILDGRPHWFSARALEAYGLSGLTPPQKSSVLDAEYNSVTLAGVEEEDYRIFMENLFRLLEENAGGSYKGVLQKEDTTYDSFQKVQPLTRRQIRIDEYGLTSYELAYPFENKICAVYAQYYRRSYAGHEAGEMVVRFSNMSEDWGELPFNK
jgi:hypothetical protein